MEIINEEKPQDLPYGAEYAKSNRALCKGCKNSILKVSNKIIS